MDTVYLRHTLVFLAIGCGFCYKIQHEAEFCGIYQLWGHAGLCQQWNDWKRTSFSFLLQCPWKHIFHSHCLFLESWLFNPKPKEAHFRHKMRNKKGNCDFLSHNSDFFSSQLRLKKSELW